MGRTRVHAAAVGGR